MVDSLYNVNYICFHLVFSWLRIELRTELVDLLRNLLTISVVNIIIIIKRIFNINLMDVDWFRHFLRLGTEMDWAIYKSTMTTRLGRGF